jgi:acyl carrier protein
MQTTDIEREIRGFLINTFLFGRDEQLRDSDSLLSNVIDSTGALELVVFLQERFGINVDDEDVIPDNFDSVKSVVRYVVKKRGSET